VTVKLLRDYAYRAGFLLGEVWHLSLVHFFVMSAVLRPSSASEKKRIRRMMRRKVTSKSEKLTAGGL